MRPISWNGVLVFVRKAAWALFLLFLPITSFPFFPGGFGGGTLVRPLSLYPLLVLLCLATFPRLLTRPVPRTLLSIMPFILAILASSALSTLQGIDSLLGISVYDRLLRALITLFIGVAIYFTVSLVPDSREELRTSLRWLFAGFFLAFAWGSLQAVYILKFSPAYFQKLNLLQSFVSIRKLFPTRISGMTYEPNWFAEQISVLMLPWLFASILTGYSLFSWRWKKVTLEWLLLAWAVGLIAFTYSRAGYLNLIAISVVTMLFFAPAWRHSHRMAPGLVAIDKPNSKPWRRRILEVVLLVAVFSGLTFLAGTRNTFFARLWSFFYERKDQSLSSYMEYIGFGARVAYVGAAMNIYDLYPLFGVGPGNYAFYFEEALPDQPLPPTPELLRIISPEEGRNRLITPKNFYLRLIAETGLVGTAAFLVFFVAVLGCGIFLWMSDILEERFYGAAALLGLFVFTLSAISFDSFALPNMWVLFGLITAAAAVSSKASIPEESPNPY